MAKRRQNISLSTSNSTDDDEKKAIRRDNERQRRQQMTFLNASLRSQLPHELIKVLNLYLFLVNIFLYIYDFTSKVLYTIISIYSYVDA